MDTSDILEVVGHRLELSPDGDQILVRGSILDHLRQAVTANFGEVVEALRLRDQQRAAADAEAFHQHLLKAWESGQELAEATQAYGGDPRRYRAPSLPEVKRRLERSKK